MKVVTNLSLSSFGGIERVLADVFGNSNGKLSPVFVTRSSQDETEIFAYDSSQESEALPSFNSGIIPTFAISKSFKEKWVSNYINGDYTNFNFTEPYVRRLESYLREVKPDVALVNSTNDLAYLLSEASKRVGIPYVAAVHGLHSIEVGIDKRFSEKAVIEGSNVSSFVSQHVRNVVERNMEIIPVNPEVVYNSLDSRFIYLGEYPYKDGVCWVGRNHRIKNLDLLLDIARDNPEDLFRAIINPPVVGNKPENVEIRRPVNDPLTLSDFYRSHNFLLSTSLFETFGNVPLEAVCNGTPALVPRTMGISSLFDSIDLNHLVIDNLDKQKFSDRMKELRGYRIPVDTRRELGEMFSAQKVAQNYIDLLARAIHNSENSPDKKVNFS